MSALETARGTEATDGGDLTRGQRRFLAGQADPWVRMELEAVRREAAGQRQRRIAADARAKALTRQVAWLWKELRELEQQLREALIEKESDK